MFDLENFFKSYNCILTFNFNYLQKKQALQKRLFMYKNSKKS